jgi:hypothetical protein
MTGYLIAAAVLAPVGLIATLLLILRVLIELADSFRGPGNLPCAPPPDGRYSGNTDSGAARYERRPRGQHLARRR